MAVIDRGQRGQQSQATQIARPELVDSWSLVTFFEVILLVLFSPALFRIGLVAGVAAVALAMILLVAALTLRRGATLGYHLLTLLHLIASVSLLVAALAFLITVSLQIAVIILLALFVAGYLRHRGQRGYAIVVQALVLIMAIIALITSPPEARPRINIMLAALVLFLFCGGAVRFYFGQGFDQLDQYGVFTYFGLAAPSSSRRMISRWLNLLGQWLQAGYRALDGLLAGPLGSIRSGIGSAGRRIRAIRPHGNSQKALQVTAIILGLLLFPYLIRLLEGAVGISVLISINVALLFVVLALGLNIVVGFAGLLDLGYAAFFAIGAYTVGVFTWPNLGLQWSFWIAIVVAVIVSSIFGMLIGAPTLRLRGDYLAIVTLAFGEIVPRAIREFWDIKIKVPFTNFYILSKEGLFHDSGGKFVEGFNLTNGPQGMNPVGRPVILGHEIGVSSVYLGPLEIPSQIQWYLLILLLGGIVLFASFRLERSRLGRAWMAIREDETAADAMGVDPIRTRLLAFALGASFSGFAGAIYAAMIQAIFPELFSFLVSIFLLIIVIVSGMGNIWGVLVGGLLISLFDRVFLAQIVPEFIPGGDVLQRWRWVMYASGLIAIMVFRPEGIFPSATRKAELHEAEEEMADFDMAAALESEQTDELRLERRD